MWCLMAFSDLCDSVIFCQFSQQCPDRSLQNKQCSVARDSWGLLLLPGVCPWILTLFLHHPSPSLCDWTGSSAATGKVLIQGDTWPHYCWWHFSLCLQDVNSNNDKITLFFFSPVILQYNMLQEKGKAAEICNGTESTGFWENLPESFSSSE